MNDPDGNFFRLQRHLATIAQPGMMEVNAATNFAIDANASGRADLSIALLDPLARRAPNFAKVWQLLGLAWRDEQDMAKAADAFDRAAALAPQDGLIAMAKAQIAYEIGRPSSHLFNAVRSMVRHSDGELELSAASALFHEGKPEEGERLILEILNGNPGWLRGLDALATMRWMSGDVERFDCAFADSVKVQPQDLALRLGWYRAVSQVGQWEKAEAIIADARSGFGDRIELDAIEAGVATEKGEDARAEALFAKVAALDDPGVKISYIRHCLRTGQIDKAESIGNALIETPAAAMVWPYMSTIWRLRGSHLAGWLDGDPPYIRQYDLPISGDELGALAACLRRLHITNYHPPEQSLRGGTQTQNHLFLRLEPELLQIRALILDAVRAYVDSLPVLADHPLLTAMRGNLAFQGAWSVRLAAQGYHVVHTHPLGWISSAFYVALPETMGEGHAGWLQLGAPPPDLRVDLPPYAEIEPKPGRLVLFPSTMWHGTVPFHDGERLTIAFDMRKPVRR